jgi:hypothetical protein
MISTEIVVPDSVTLHHHILSGELVELGFVPLQGVDLAVTDESEISALLDACPRTFGG